MTHPLRRYGGAPKLEDCVAHGAGSGAELFVVEGDSAAASVSGVRDPAFQAVLPMQGKPLNAVKASRKKVLGHAWFAALTAAIGTGLDPEFSAAGLRDDRLLLLMDPDADGIHCCVLTLLFLHRWMRPLVEAGRIEIVRPPWGEVAVAGDPAVRLGFSEPHLMALAAELQARARGGAPLPGTGGDRRRGARGSVRRARHAADRPRHRGRDRPDGRDAFRRRCGVGRTPSTQGFPE